MIFAALAGVWQHMNGRRIARAGGARHKRRLRRARRETRDSIEISTEAVYRFAAREYDPRRITFAEAVSLIELLFEGGAIKLEERGIMLRSVADLREWADAPESDDRPTDIIHSLEYTTEHICGETIRSTGFAKTLAVLRLVNSRRRGSANPRGAGSPPTAYPPKPA